MDHGKEKRVKKYKNKTRALVVNETYLYGYMLYFFFVDLNVAHSYKGRQR